MLQISPTSERNFNDLWVSICYKKIEILTPCAVYYSNTNTTLTRIILTFK